MPALTARDLADPLAEQALRRCVWRAAVAVIAGLGVLVLSGLFTPLVAYVLILAACVLIGHGGNVFIRALLTEGRRLRSLRPR